MTYTNSVHDTRFTSAVDIGYPLGYPTLRRGLVAYRARDRSRSLDDPLLVENVKVPRGLGFHGLFGSKPPWSVQLSPYPPCFACS